MTTLIPEEIALVCHEANRAVQQIQLDNGESDLPVSLPWWEASQEIRDSATDGVSNALEGSSPQQSHENWMDFKIENGWVFGEVKDEDAKTHPLLVPYDQLPESQQVKDHLFLAIVAALS